MWKNITKQVDLINMMTFNYHLKENKRTGFISPLKIGNDDPFQTDYDSKFSVEAAL